MPYLSTDIRVSLRNQLTILLIRGIYGIIVALILHMMFSIDTNIVSILKNVFGDYHQYFTWLYLFALYPLSIIIIKIIVNTKKRYDLYLRGISIYFASAVIAYTIISAI